VINLTTKGHVYVCSFCERSPTKDCDYFVLPDPHSGNSEELYHVITIIFVPQVEFKLTIIGAYNLRMFKFYHLLTLGSLP